MRLRSVRLKNYRGVDDCTVAFPIQGVTIVEGDNEVGKTCIPEAVNLILNELDSSGKRAVKAIRPVHRDAGPEVEVEITSGDYQFTYFKRWHRKPETTLEITAPQREQLTGREAHERVEAILNETLDQDLWKALSIKQGAELELPSFGSSSLGRALDQAAGGSEIEGREDDLWKRICTERLKYWTSTGKAIQERRSLADGLDQAQDAVEALEARLKGLEDDVAEAARLAEDEGDLTARCNEADEAESKLSEQWAATESLRTQVNHLAAVHTAAQAQHRQITSDYGHRQEMADSVKAEREKLAFLEAEVKQATPELALAEQNSKEAFDALAEAREARLAAEKHLRLANNDRDYHRNLIEKDQVSERHERVIAAQANLVEAEATLDASLVDDELVNKIEEANLEVASARAALGATAASVEATALAPLFVLIDGEEVKLEADTTYQSDVTGNWEIVIPDVIQVGVQAGTGSRDLVAALQAAQDAHDRLCAQGGVGGLAEARERAEQRRDAARCRDDAIATIKQDLRDLTPEVLALMVKRLSKRVASYPADRPKSPLLPSDFDEAKKVASDAEKADTECQAELERCERNASKADGISQEAKRDAAVQAERLKIARDTVEMAEQKLEEARQGRSDRQLDEALAADQAKVNEADAALEQAENELQAQDPDSLQARLDNARHSKNRAQRDLEDNRERQKELRVRLDTHGEAGLHSELNDAISKHEHLLREHDRTEARAEAARLLFETFEKRRKEAHQRYVAPFKEEIEKLGRIVFGPTFEVDLDTDLRVSRRTLKGITLDVAQLSTGAQEQLGVICRLACAAIVSPDGGGAPVVIDDALGWSDPSRLQTMGAAIAAAGHECQVIVLTCTPGRYAHVGNAQVARLPG